MYDELIKSTTLDSLYRNLITLWGGLDYVGVSKEHLSFRYIDNICIINKDLEFIDIDYINEPIFIEKKYLKSNYVKSFFGKKRYKLEINKIQWMGLPFPDETLINTNNNILIDLYDFIHLYNNWELSNFKYNPILLLSNKINKFELMKKIYLIYHNRYNLEKFIKSLYRYRENEILLNRCIENYNNVDMLNDIYTEYISLN